MFERIYQNFFYKFLFKFWRSGRKKLFLERLRPQLATRLIAVGGAVGFWDKENLGSCRLVVLNLPQGLLVGPVSGRQVFKAWGDGCFLPFPAGAFDIVFSNSVIEHLGSWEKQQKFAAEALRVGKGIWIQTPAYECPLEPHFLAPLVHWLPVSWRYRLARHFTLWGLLHQPTQEAARAMVNEIRLLRKKEMQTLFPDCEIITERLFWIFPKSHIALRIR